jgi:hypothetical protein
MSKCLKQEKSSQRKVGCVQPKGCSVWGTGLSGGAPHSVRCARLTRANWPLSGIRRRRTAIIHRTVRCAPDCPVSQRSAGPTVGHAICARHVAESTVGRGHRTVRCAPDANGSQICNGRLRCLWNEIGHRTVSGVHRTVRCTRRQKAGLAFPDLFSTAPSCLGAIKGTPRRMEEYTKHSYNIPKHQDIDLAHSFHCDSI